MGATVSTDLRAGLGDIPLDDATTQVSDLFGRLGFAVCLGLLQLAVNLDLRHRCGRAEEDDQSCGRTQCVVGKPHPADLGPSKMLSPYCHRRR